MTTTAVMTADLAVLASDPGVLEQSADPATFVMLACERAKTWLAQALDHGQIEQIVELKSQAEAIRVYTVQKQLGKDAELSAAEVVRRAERGIGVAIRRGQAAGAIKRSERHGNHDAESMSPPEVAQAPQSTVSEYYDLTDEVTPEQFDAALTEAKDEGNLSRANVVRKVRGEAPKPSGRPEHLRGMRHFDAYRAISESVYAVDGVRSVLDRLEPHHLDDLDPGEVSAWVDSLTESIRSLNRLQRQLKELTQA